MSVLGKKLGILLSTPPAHPNFNHALRLAETALAKGVQVFLYCIDEAVAGVEQPRVQQLQARGVKLFACAYAARRRSLALEDHAVLAGLSVVSELVAGTDRFVSFN
ncbi:MAG: DsrE family protein [Verrucomicrobia bacterium]|nr:DsrE family protein [Verrucomicrobiota bacterium]